MRCIGGIATPTDGADDLQKENFDGSDYCADLASDLKDAIDEMLASGAVTMEQIPSMGCNIKWKPA